MIKIFSYCPFRIRRKLIRKTHISIPDIYDIITGSVNINNVFVGNLKNTYNLPIASGIYIVHIDALGIGEKIIKWFGVMRPIDMETF